MRRWIFSAVVYSIVVFIAFGCSNDNRVEGRAHIDSKEFVPNNTKIYSATGIFKEQPVLSDKKVFTFVLLVDYKSVANYEIDECELDKCEEDSIRVMCVGKEICEVLSLGDDDKYTNRGFQAVHISEDSRSQKRTIEITHTGLLTKIEKGASFKVRAFDASEARSETFPVEIP